MNNNTNEKPTEESNWIGPSGARWLANVDRFEHMIRPIGRALIERAAVRPGENVIDIGCGAGETTLALARAVGPTGQITGLDISPPLLAEAERRANALAEKLQVQFVLGDAAHVAIPFGPVDCLVSRFGVMFFSDPYAAFAHLHGLLRSGGRIAFACWAPPKQNAWTLEVRNVLAEHIDLPKMTPRAPGPFAFDDPDYVKDLLNRATFKNIEIVAWQASLPVGGPGSDPTTAMEFLMNAISVTKVVADVPAEVQESVRQKLSDRLQTWMTPTGVQMPAAVWLVTASA